MAFTAFASWKVEDGLWLEAQKGGVTYRARASVGGRKGYFATGQKDRAKAETVAKKWFRQFRAESSSTPVHTMKDAAEIHEEHYPAARASARQDFKKRWKTISSIRDLADTDVREVDTKWLRDFLKVRGHLKETTQKKDMDTIRPVLRVAFERGWIDHVPPFPKVSPQRNPEYPFTPDEWQRILAQMEKDCEDADTPYQRRLTQDVHDHAVCIVQGLLRPREVLRVTVADIHEDTDPATGKPRIGFRVRRKTGLQGAVVWARFTRLQEVLRRRVGDARQEGRDLLFPYGNRVFSDAFGALLDRMKLRYATGSDNPRSSWSLRPTGICLEILRQRTATGAADYLRIAKWAGTSMMRINNNYASYLPDEEFSTPPPKGMDGFYLATTMSRLQDDD